MYDFTLSQKELNDFLPSNILSEIDVNNENNFTYSNSDSSSSSADVSSIIYYIFIVFYFRI